MTSRERVFTALSHEQPDRVPYCVGFTAKAHAKLAEYFGDPDFAGKIHNDLAAFDVGIAEDWHEVRPCVWRDEFGVEWDQSVDKDIGVVCNRVVDESTIDEAPFPNPDDPRRWKPFEAMPSSLKDTFKVANLGFSLFERAWTLFGMENLLMAMATTPDVVNRLLDRILAYNLRIVERACSYEVDAMMFGDDWGSQAGLIMGPDLWRMYIKPRIRQMYGAARDHGKFVFIHSCGKVDELFPDLIECGLNCFNPFQPEVMDPYQTKQRYGDELSFFGGISTQKTLPYATPDEVRAEVERLLREVGRNGGYIAAPAHATPGDAKAENMAAMLEVLENQ